jgi:hypothetical protein
MTTSNHLLNALVADNRVEADDAFESIIHDKMNDWMEVRKVELASSILDDLVQEGMSPDELEWRREIINNRKKGSLVKFTKSKDSHAGAKTYHTTASAPMGTKKKYYGHFAHGSKTAYYTNQNEDVVVDKAFNEETITEEEHTAAHELVMYADNDSQLYKSSHQPIIANLKKKVKKGTYDHDKATKLWGYHADRAAQKYAKEHGDGTPWHKMFTPSDRKNAAKFFAHDNKAEIYGVHEAVEPGAAPSNAALNRNVLANIRRATSTLKLKGVNPTLAAAGHRDFGKLVAKNPKAPGYMLLRKLSAAKAAAVQSLTQAGVPLGGSLEANPNDFNQVIQKIKRFR